MVTQNKSWQTTDYYDYHEPYRMVEHDVPMRPSNSNLLNVITLEDETTET